MPISLLELRVPENALYQREILDKALTKFLAGKITRQETMQQIEQEWEQTTDRVGRESQLKAYRSSLGAE